MNLCHMIRTAIAPSAFAIALVLGAASMVGCDDRSDAEKSIDRAGDKMEKAADKAGDNIEKAADKTGDNIEKAADKVGDKAEDAADKVKDAAK